MEFPELKDALIEKRFEEAKEIYSALNVDVEGAIDTLLSTPISMHCWQGDDVTGFETKLSTNNGGTLVTGNHPGAATTPEDLRADIDKALIRNKVQNLKELLDNIDQVVGIGNLQNCTLFGRKSEGKGQIVLDMQWMAAYFRELIHNLRIVNR